MFSKLNQIARPYPPLQATRHAIRRHALLPALRLFCVALLVCAGVLSVPAKPAKAAGGYVWRTLLLVYTNANVQYTDSSGQQQSLSTNWTFADRQSTLQSWKNLPGFARLYSNGQATIEQTVQTASAPLAALTDYGDHTYWISPANVQDQLSAIAPPGMYDSIFVLARLHDPATGKFVPLRGRTTSTGPVASLGGATFASIVDTNGDYDPCQDDLWLGAWLAGVSQFYAANGFAMPAGGYYSAEMHNSQQDPSSCWDNWIKAYMTGAVSEPAAGGAKTGVSPSAWQFGTPTQQGGHQNGIATLANYLQSLGFNQNSFLSNTDPNTNYRFVPNGFEFLNPISNRWELFWLEGSGYYTFNYWNESEQAWLLFDPGIRDLAFDGITIDQYSARMRNCPYTNFQFAPSESIGYFQETSNESGHIEQLWAHLQDPATDGYHLYRYDGLNPVYIPDGSILSCATRAVSLSPTSATKFGNRGTTVSYTLVATNTGITSDQFKISISGNAWPVLLSTADTGTLAPQASTTINVNVMIPSTQGGSLQDKVTVTFTSQNDPNSSSSATFTTLIQLTPVYLPVAIAQSPTGW